MKDKKIGVVMGGPSAEREVSLNTGKAIFEALKEKGYNVISIDMEPRRIIEQLKEAKVDVVFNAIHGKYGEDGALQGALDMLGIPYTGSGVLASAIAMDKAISKRLFLSDDLPTPRSKIYAKRDVRSDITEEIAVDFGFPVVVKAASQGSSIGVEIVQELACLDSAIEGAFKYSDHIIVEAFISGKELTVGVIGNGTAQVLPIIEIVPHSGRYDYHSKYTKGATEYIVPAILDKHIVFNVQQIALKAFNLLGCKGVVRVDFMLDKDNNPYVLEVNTIPGFTATSLVPKAAAAAGISFPDLCERLLLMAIQ